MLDLPDPLSPVMQLNEASQPEITVRVAYDLNPSMISSSTFMATGLKGYLELVKVKLDVAIIDLDALFTTAIAGFLGNAFLVMVSRDTCLEQAFGIIIGACWTIKAVLMSCI